MNTRIVLWSIIFSVDRRSEGHFFFFLQVFAKAAGRFGLYLSFFQQGGTNLLFFMHCQIQLELTLWALLPSSGVASVCVAEAAA